MNNDGGIKSFWLLPIFTADVTFALFQLHIPYHVSAQYLVSISIYHQLFVFSSCPVRLWNNGETERDRFSPRPPPVFFLAPGLPVMPTVAASEVENTADGTFVIEYLTVVATRIRKRL